MLAIFRSIGALAVAAVLVAPVSAQTLADRDRITQDKANLAQYAVRVNSACGSHIRFSINYASYTGKHPAAGVRQQAYEAYLENAGDAIINICTTPDGKAAVLKSIKAVVGGYADSETSVLSGGVFTYRTSFAGGSVAAPEQYLKAHL